MAERAGAPLSSGLGRCVLRGVEAMDMPDNDSTGVRIAEPDEEALCHVLGSLATKWQELGSKIDLGSQDLDLSLDLKDRDAGDCLTELVRRWLQRGKVTWMEVVKLLDEIGEVGKAKELATAKCVLEEEEEEKISGPPSYKIQKSEIYAALQQVLKKGDTWYLVDMRWMKQWKKFVGYDQWDQTFAGQASANPGPVDNSNLFKQGCSEPLKEHLMEELDYYLLSESAWAKLSSWYGVGASSRPIVRKVVEHGLYMKHCKVEVYLMDFKLSLHPNYETISTKSFSRGDTVADLAEMLKTVFDVPAGAECRVWHRYMTHTYELLSNSSQTLQDAGLYNGQTIVLEKRNEDGTWPRTVHLTSSSQHPTRSTDDSFSRPPSSSSGSSSTSSSVYGSTSYAYGSSYSQKPSSPGLCGLSSLGNTCFMNAALQCLSNTSNLTKYFVGTASGYKPYKKHINKVNPLGMSGAIAETYGALLEDMWSGKFTCVAPRHFKTQVGRYAPQFVGYAQHDSQELLAFLLDGLHEDLNLVKKKPYVDMTVETEGRSDKEIAEESWLKYLERNQSVIVRSFQGQLKSTLVCPTCNEISKIFDPFMFLSLPLPINKTLFLVVTLVRADPKTTPTMYKLCLPKRGAVQDLKTELHRMVGVPLKKMVVVDIYNSKFHRVYADSDSLNQIQDRDNIYVYELPSGDDVILISVYLREEMSHDMQYSSTSYSQRYYQLFGVPLVVTIPRECSYSTIYHAILAQGCRYMKTWTQVKNEELSVQEGEDLLGASCDGSVCDNEMDAANEERREGEDGKSGVGEEDSLDKDKEEDVEMQEVCDFDEEKTDSGERPLFKLVVVNSYGSQEVQNLEPSKTYTFSKQVYIACHWSPDVKEKCYDQKRAQVVIRHESCDVKNSVKKTLQLMDCLKLFVQKETLSKDNAWYCPHCEEFVQATKKLDLWKLPDVLVIHLKRFSYERYWREKLDMLVEFPIKEFNLTDMVECPSESQPLYDLFAISNHFGGMGGGHYTAYAKNKATKKWYNFDDSHVSETFEERLVSASAYVLFYERRSAMCHVPVLDRSLSQSFAEEKKLLSNKYNIKTEPTTLQEESHFSEDEMSSGEAEEDVNLNDLEQPD